MFSSEACQLRLLLLSLLRLLRTPNQSVHEGPGVSNAGDPTVPRRQTERKLNQTQERTT